MKTDHPSEISSDTVRATQTSGKVAQSKNVHQTSETKKGISLIYSYGIVGLLLLAAIVLYAPKMLWPAQESSAAANSHSYVSDLDFWRRTNREVHVASLFPLDLDGDLNQVPMTIGKWVGQDMPDMNREVEILLEPEQYVRRLYQHENGQYMWLSLIGGRSSQPFHAPDICYDADGWQYNLGSHPFTLSNDGQIYGLWLDAEKKFEENAEPVEHFVSYFYIFPDHDRELSDGIILFKLTSSKFGSQEETLAVHHDFVGSVFGGIQYK